MHLPAGSLSLNSFLLSQIGPLALAHLFECLVKSLQAAEGDRLGFNCAMLLAPCAARHLFLCWSAR
jgi:hypothetical protein